MANNLSVKDALAATVVVKTTDTASVHTPHQNIDSIAAGDNNIGNVDVVTLPALVAGTAAIGKLVANSGVDIGDVDVLSIAAGDNNIGNVDLASAIPAGTNNIGDVDVLSVIPGTGATNLGKAIDTATGATDTGVLALATRDDALGALTPIEGDTVGLRTDANGALWTHDDALDAALSGSELQVDVVAALPAGTNNIGDVDVLTIAAGDNNIGNVDLASAIPAGTNNIGDVDVLTIAAGDNNIGNVDVVTLPALVAGTAAIGKLLPSDVDVTTNTNHAQKYYTSAGAATDGIIWSPAAGKRWHITTLTIQISAAATVTLEDDLAGGDSAIYKAEFAANSGIVLTFHPEHPWASGEDAADLIITTSAGNVYVTCVGFEI